MKENTHQREFGIVSLSPWFSLLGLLFSTFYIRNGVLLSEYIIGAIIPSGIITFILWGIAIYLGRKYPDHKWARTGYKITLVFITIFIALFLLSLIL